jgi:hypothetical protein
MPKQTLRCSLALIFTVAVDTALAQPAPELPTDIAVAAMLAGGDVAAVTAAGTALAAACSEGRVASVCYRAAHAHYVRALMTMRDGRNSAANALVACGTTLAPLGADPALAGEAKALLSGCYGLSIALNPMKGMSLGPESARLVAEALAAAPDSPRVHYFAAMRLARTPAAWGGDPAEALVHALRGRELLAGQQADAIPAWGAAEIERLVEELEAKAGAIAPSRE